MGTYTFRLPDIGEGIAEAEIVAWHVAVGDMVEEDGRLADMMTDKATVEMESPVSGRIVSIAGEVGDVVAIGSALVVIETDGQAEAEAPASSQSAAPAPAAEVVEERIEVETPDAADVTRVEAAAPPPPPPPAPTPKAVPTKPVAPANTRDAGAKFLASPAVRQRAHDLGIDLSEVRPSEEGRVRHADLDQFLAYNAMGGYRSAGAERGDEIIKVIGMRRRIAENMAASKRHIPHFSYVEECDVTALEAMRDQLNTNRGDKPKLTLLPLLITAICRTLPQYPMINARYDDEAGVVTRYGAVHLGMAAQTPAGLMVPVIRNAQNLNLWQLAREIVRLAEAARSGSAKSEELSGSTLTITSLGPLGGVATTPVINRPEVAIIGPNRIIERPMFVPDGMGGERIEKRKLMNISISCDHRVVDGHDAASFVQAIRKLIETPVLMLAD
ncbi:dihydrolipoamide acetyltransferase family protein [Novosphingobium taihuense]|uniref:Dihydrolipoamide acetyltransferase component of pyruvate dehydrogenase complex n=1 Tax=Novosphingobium taihuense TaxID=260085 RepID=A0A7W7EUB3_9SPHN|nr:dihydrolipoamide acetyltransferase family protein [Novosphingobium taihuense]MBB4613879.1 2-oxoisovalerate dehydrogenase E2 component (dihydrolipoyl transacylase) [Novosphingobium taihuense]TWH83385.1 2-oxoisovalerate dehydrogenase E2 component (dihydrolipoyl transacylase) [Novosphingobium taihuense]